MLCIAKTFFKLCYKLCTGTFLISPPMYFCPVCSERQPGPPTPHEKGTFRCRDCGAPFLLPSPTTGLTDLLSLTRILLGLLHGGTPPVADPMASGSILLSSYGLDSEEAITQVLTQSMEGCLHAGCPPRATPPAFTFGVSPRPVVGIVYHEGMLGHVCCSEAGREGVVMTPSERPDRLQAAGGYLVGTGLFQACVRLLAREATEEELALVTTKEHRAYVEQQFARTLPYPHPTTAHFAPGDLYWSPGTGLAARMALGSVIQAVECAQRGVVHRALCLVRPPGHHAHNEASRGFCVFNNVAGALLKALSSPPSPSSPPLTRVLVVDLDVHHGDGTEAVFYEDPRVLTFSLHRYDHGEYYPGSGHAHRVGEGAGEGFNCNVGLNGEWQGDREVAGVTDAILAPLARAFDPQLIVVSLGCDSGRGDPLGDWDVSPSGYAYTLSTLCSLGVPLVVALEGGYNCVTVAGTVGAVARVLLGEQAPSPFSAGEAGLPVLPERAVLEGSDGGYFVGLGTKEGEADREFLATCLKGGKQWREDRERKDGGLLARTSSHPGRRMGMRPSTLLSIQDTLTHLQPFWPGVFPLGAAHTAE